jgi:DNA-binding response OmpR family regulator
MIHNGKAKVLLVDDDRDISLNMKNGLESHGFNVTTFNDPMQALSRFKASHYDFILLDTGMLGMTGFELARKVWTIDPGARVCFFSALEIHENEARIIFKDLKTVYFVKKPIRPSELALTIEMHLQQTELQPA